MVLRLLVRRILWLVPLLVGMTMVLFILTHLLPADPVRIALGQDATPDQVRAYREELKLNDPLWRQYLRYVGELAHGNFGNSIISRRPVVQDLGAYFPATLELSLASIVLSTLVSVPLGIVSAIKRGKAVDQLAQVVSLFTISMPVFWFGVLLQVAFYVYLGWLPVSGRLSSGVAPPASLTGLYTVDSLLEGRWGTFIDALRHLALPAVTLSNINLAVLTRITRSSMLDVLNEQYLTTARAKGLSNWVIIWRHALKNALVPIATLASLRFGDLVAGAVLTETIFAWPGIGQYAVFSIERVDYPALIGFAIIVTLAYVMVNLATDVLYLAVDPRMRM